MLIISANDKGLFQSLYFSLNCLYNKNKGFGGIMMNTIDILNEIRARESGILNKEKFRKAAVLLPLVEIKGETHILFEVRSSKMRSQPGDICFPGGRVEDTDETKLAAAIRETSEELGVSTSSITDVTPLDYMVSDIAGIIYPYIGRLSDIDDLNINKFEVAEVFTVPLNYFLQTEPECYRINFKVEPEKDFPFELIQNGEDYDWRLRQTEELFYVYDSHRVIWGLTAKIVYHLVDILKGNEKEK